MKEVEHIKYHVGYGRRMHGMQIIQINYIPQQVINCKQIIK